MEFLREIAGALGADAAGAFRIQYAVVDGKGGYFQNGRRLAEFSRERVVLRGREGGVCVEGHDLSIGKYYAGDIVIAGDIVRVERLEREDAGGRQGI